MHLEVIMGIHEQAPRFLASNILLCGLFIAGCAINRPSGESQVGRFEFGLIGDLPYTAEDEKKFPNLIEDMNKANLAFVVHNGDFQADGNGWNEKTGGGEPCSDETFQNRLALAQSFNAPFILTPGDNDWTDCHRAKPRTFDPLERLTKVRGMFFGGDQSLGQRTMHLTRQSENPKYANFRENLRWNYGDILFVTVHMVGSNNNLGRTRDMDAEYTDRTAANFAWLREAFSTAKQNGTKAVMIITQANPGFWNNWTAVRFNRYILNSPVKAPEKRIPTGYDEFLVLIETETVAFGKPVVFVHGDSHIFRIDQPLVSSKTGRVIENFTRVETFGTPDVHWVKVIVDANDPDLFTFKPEIVKKNLVNHSVK